MRDTNEHFTLTYLVMKSIKGKCLECGQTFSGREGKKFCDDVCRSAYNNKRYRKNNSLMRSINRTLAKNRQILENLNPKGKARVAKNTLIQLGFNFSYFTSIYETREGRRYYFCYEQGYFFLDDNWLALVIRKEYVANRA